MPDFKYYRAELKSNGEFPPDANMSAMISMDMVFTIGDKMDKTPIEMVNGTLRDMRISSYMTVSALYEIIPGQTGGIFERYILTEDAIEWILTASVEITHVGNTYLIVERGGSRRCSISYNDKGRMLFDGQDIETEAYMAFVGLLDSVDESPAGETVYFAAGELWPSR
jgi:hypothetical protein